MATEINGYNTEQNSQSFTYLLSSKPIFMLVPKNKGNEEFLK